MHNKAYTVSFGYPAHTALLTLKEFANFPLKVLRGLWPKPGCSLLNAGLQQHVIFKEACSLEKLRRKPSNNSSWPSERELKKGQRGHSLEIAEIQALRSPGRKNAGHKKGKLRSLVVSKQV